MISCFTIMAVLYVHQQVELVKVSYAIEHKERLLKDMLDHNNHLGYNIDNLESPSCLEQTLLARHIDITFPKKGNVVTVAGSPKSRAADRERLQAAKVNTRFGMFSIIDFFTQGREAQAKE